MGCIIFYFPRKASSNSIGFTSRFLIQLKSIRMLVKSHRKIDNVGYTLVLLKDDVLPFTFLNYFFVSQKQYNESALEPEILEHELAHIQQRHSCDILFIEILKCVFWFNPILVLYKKAIELNHEFLAD